MKNFFAGLLTVLCCMPIFERISASAADFRDPFHCRNTDTCNRSNLATYAKQNKHSLDYESARERMFQYVDVYTDAQGKRVVDSVYSDDIFNVGVQGIPKDGVNTEHTWPQSQLKDAPNFAQSKTDIYHIFPVEIKINGERGNLPFTECSEDKEHDKGSTGLVCDSGFEPPNKQKGFVARAMFYMAVAYNLQISPDQETVLRLWNDEFPVTPREKERAVRISETQGNHNPFIEHPEWVSLVSDY